MPFSRFVCLTFYSFLTYTVNLMSLNSHFPARGLLHEVSVSQRFVLLFLQPVVCVMHIHSFIHSGYFYSAFSSPLLLRGTIPTQYGYCVGVSRHRKQRVKDFLKASTWRLERNSNPRPFGRKATNLPISHYPHEHLIFFALLYLDWHTCTYFCPFCLTTNQTQS